MLLQWSLLGACLLLAAEITLRASSAAVRCACASVFQALAPAGTPPAARAATARRPPSSAGRPPCVRARGHEARGSAVPRSPSLALWYDEA